MPLSTPNTSPDDNSTGCCADAGLTAAASAWLTSVVVDGLMGAASGGATKTHPEATSPVWCSTGAGAGADSRGVGSFLRTAVTAGPSFAALGLSPRASVGMGPSLTVLRLMVGLVAGSPAAHDVSVKAAPLVGNTPSARRASMGTSVGCGACDCSRNNALNCGRLATITAVRWAGCKPTATAGFGIDFGINFTLSTYASGEPNRLADSWARETPESTALSNHDGWLQSVACAAARKLLPGQ